MGEGDRGSEWAARRYRMGLQGLNNGAGGGDGEKTSAELISPWREKIFEN